MATTSGSKAAKVRQVSEVAKPLGRSDAFCEPSNPWKKPETPSASEASAVLLESLTDEQRRVHFWNEALRSLKLPFARKGTEQYTKAMIQYKQLASDYERVHHPHKTHDDLVAMNPDERKQYLWQSACIDCGVHPRVGTPEYDEVMALYIKLVRAFEATQVDIPVDANSADACASD